MEKDTHETVVIFRKWRGRNGTVFALFPEMPGTADPYTCGSYEHVGQHSSADPQHCIAKSYPIDAMSWVARNALRMELEDIGYKLRIVTRLNAKHIETRRKALAPVSMPYRGGPQL